VIENRETPPPSEVELSTKRETGGRPGREFPEDVVVAWWSELIEQPTSGEGAGAKRPNRKGERAELRRCSSVGEIAFCRAYLRLRSKLTAAGMVGGSFPLDWLAVVAGVLAHAKVHSPAPGFPPNVGAQLGAAKGDKSVVSDARFRRFLEIDEPEEMLRHMARFVRMLDGAIDVKRLSRDLLSFRGEQADSVRKEWAFAYYEASPEKK
jgi:CRISPR system Cascade subunit CasB